MILKIKSRARRIVSLAAGCFIALLLGNSISSFGKVKGKEHVIKESIDETIQPAENANWMVGISRRVLTPATDVWLAGYGSKRPVVGKLHDIWVKVLALKSSNGKRAVMVTTDNQGMSRTIYENLYKKVQERFQLDRSEFMLTFSHNHSGPRLRGDLVDYYPSDDGQRKLVDEYSDWMEGQAACSSMPRPLHQ